MGENRRKTQQKAPFSDATGAKKKQPLGCHLPARDFPMRFSQFATKALARWVILNGAKVSQLCRAQY